MEIPEDCHYNFTLTPTSGEDYYWYSDRLNCTNTTIEHEELNDDHLNTLETFIISVILGSITLFTIVGNAVVTYISCKANKFSSPCIYNILAISVMGVVGGTLVLPAAAVYEVLGYWPWGRWWCTRWLFFDSVSAFGYAFLMIVTIADKLTEVGNIKCMGRTTPRRTTIMIIIAMSLTLLLSVAVSIWENTIWKHKSDLLPDTYCSIGVDDYIILFATLCGFWIPLVFITLLCVGILIIRGGRVCSGNRQRLSPDAMNGDSVNGTFLTSHEFQLDDSNLARALSVVVCAYGLCWFPIYLTILAYQVLKYLMHSSIIISVTWLGYSSFMFNPLIFLVIIKEFRIKFVKLLRLKRSRDGGNEMEL